jgi:hypothetical protein
LNRFKTEQAALCCRAHRSASHTTLPCSLTLPPHPGHCHRADISRSHLSAACTRVAHARRLPLSQPCPRGVRRLPLLEHPRANASMPCQSMSLNPHSMLHFLLHAAPHPGHPPCPLFPPRPCHWATKKKPPTTDLDPLLPVFLLRPSTHSRLPAPPPSLSAPFPGRLATGRPSHPGIESPPPR